jgi:ribonuclease-3
MPEPAESLIALIARVLGHAMADEALLRQACTHASRCGAQATPALKRREANERMEFLGDALLGGALCLNLFRRFPDADEGYLSRLKASLASRTTLARAIEDTGILPYCHVGQQMLEPWPDSVKANLMESVLCAIYLDGGWDRLCGAVDRLFASRIDDPAVANEDGRMRLQAWCLAHHKVLPSYTCARSGGSDHEPEFRATAAIASVSATGLGSSRRRAEGAAALALLALIDSATR